jgi:hypothetical protein
MKTVNLILIQTLFLISLNCFSQNGYEMREGETIVVDEYGHILNSNMPSQITSKVNLGTTYIRSEVDINSNYNEDGTLKIPGYTPTGNKEVDESNYIKAKDVFMQTKPVEYQKWVEKNSPSVPVIEVKYEEFQIMPEIKKEYILSHSEKYHLQNPNELPDDNK